MSSVTHERFPIEQGEVLEEFDDFDSEVPTEVESGLGHAATVGSNELIEQTPGHSESTPIQEDSNGTKPTASDERTKIKNEIPTLNDKDSMILTTLASNMLESSFVYGLRRTEAQQMIAKTTGFTTNEVLSSIRSLANEKILITYKGNFRRDKEPYELGARGLAYMKKKDKETYDKLTAIELTIDPSDETKPYVAKEVLEGCRDTELKELFVGINNNKHVDGIITKKHLSTGLSREEISEILSSRVGAPYLCGNGDRTKDGKTIYRLTPQRLWGIARLVHNLTIKE